MRWQKAARLAIAVFIVAFAGFVFLALRKTGVTPPRPERLKIDAKAVAQTVGGFHWERRDKSGKVEFSIKSQNHKLYQDGRNLFGDATLDLPDRDGRNITITADEAEATQPADGASGFSTAVVRRNVKLRTSDDLIVTCNEGTYNDKEGMLQVPGPVTFTRGRMTGKGTGATYDRNRDVLWILADAQISVTPDEKGGGAMQGTAGTAGLARADHYVRLSKAAHVVADNRTIDADDLTAALTPDDQKIQTMQLRGNSRIVGTGANAQSMSAKDIDLTYGPDGRTLQLAKLMEQSAVQLPSEGGARRIGARMIDMTMAADGSTVTQLNATENVQLDLPAQGTVPAKTIKASTLAASGEGDAGLQTATFEGPVDYRETLAARGNLAAVDRHGTAKRLIVHTKPGLGDLQQAEFRGNFKFVDGTKSTAEAPIGLYQVDQDRLDLTPSTTDPGPPPTVTDGQLTVHARTISMAVSTQKLKAETDVRSIMDRKPDAGRGAPGQATQDAKEQTKLPSMLKQDQPVTVRSNRLEYDSAASHAIYSGSRTTDPTGRHRAAGRHDRDRRQVRQPHRTPQGPNEDADRRRRFEDERSERRRETIGTGEHFVYDDAKRLATYTSAAAEAGASRRRAGRPDRHADRPVPQRGRERAGTAGGGRDGHDDREQSDGAGTAPDLHSRRRNLRDGRDRRSKWCRRRRRPARRRWRGCCASSAPSTTFRPKAAR